MSLKMYYVTSHKSWNYESSKETACCRDHHRQLCKLMIQLCLAYYRPTYPNMLLTNAHIKWYFFSSELVLHTLNVQSYSLMRISLSQQTWSNYTSPFNAGETSSKNWIRNSLYLYIQTVIDASDGVLCPFYSGLSISVESPAYRKCEHI